MIQVWRKLPIAGKLYTVIGAMALLIFCELVILSLAMGTLSAVRAFVGGESMWSKGQKNAAFHIQRFGVTRDERDFEQFLASLKVPEGDHAARMELLKANPDLEVVKQGFIQGQIHPDDVMPMVKLLRRFAWEPHLAEAIGVWADADNLLVEFKEAALSYRTLLKSRHADDLKIQGVLSRLETLNVRLTAVEQRFSEALGEGSRWLERAVISVLFFLVLTVESVGLTLTFLTSRAISRGLRTIQAGAKAIGEGQLTHRVHVDSLDEIGQLAIAVDQMRALLEKSYSELEARVNERTIKLATLASENEKLYIEARDAVRARDEFMSIASHELRTPMTSLQLQVQLLAKEAEKPGPISPYIPQLANAASSQIRRLARLSDELMDLTRLSLGNFKINSEDCNLSELAAQIVNQMKPEADRAGSTLNVQVIPNLHLSCDSTRIGQVVTNLVSNAIKYGRGGSIDVSVGQHGDQTVLKVSDHGAGIPTENLGKIFERYERGSPDPNVGGLGLGLYISREIVRAHHGEIRVDSQVGVGSTFTVSLRSEV